MSQHFKDVGDDVRLRDRQLVGEQTRGYFREEPITLDGRVRTEVGVAYLYERGCHDLYASVC